MYTRISPCGLVRPFPNGTSAWNALVTTVSTCSATGVRRVSVQDGPHGVDVGEDAPKMMMGFRGTEVQRFRIGWPCVAFDHRPVKEYR